MYSFQARVRYSEADEAGCMKLDAIVDYFQDCSAFHSESLGLGVLHMKERMLAWVVNAWQIAISDYPRFGEAITVATFPYAFLGFIGYRNFYMENAAGEKIVKANSIWSLVDIRTMRPVRVEDEMKARYTLGGKLDMEYPPRKIAIPASSTCGREILVRKHHLDSNNHVNNAQYIRMALDSMPEEGKAYRLRTEYRKQALPGETIIPHIGSVCGKHVTALCDTKGNPYAIVETAP